MVNLAVTEMLGLVWLRAKRSWWSDGDARGELELLEWVRSGSSPRVVSCWRRDRRDRDSNLCSSHRWRQLTGISPGKSHGQGPWVSHEMAQIGRYSSAKWGSTSYSILLLGDAITGEAKASAHKARVTGCLLDNLDVSPPSLYILG